MQQLPIDAALDEIAARLREAGSVVVEAPPGAGKTTRVPVALLDAGLCGDHEAVVLQPRRLATRLAARRVAEERGEPLGQTVGYRVRYESVGGPRTRLRYVTEGVLSRMLGSQPTLDPIGLVVLDEFHERHVHGDVALALCRRLQLGPRPDLRLVVMSATLDAEPIARFLGDCPRVQTEGRRYEVTVQHQERADRRPLETLIALALRELLAGGLDGHVLVFLPGAAEIRRARSAVSTLAAEAGLELVVLHGNLPSAEQDRALAPSARRKVILSTNIAETSLTIEGVVAVIDSGLARVAGHAPWSGLPTLRLAPISQAAATQRAGRAGRTQPGCCVRLYTRADYDRRPGAEQPEISRIDLTEMVLAVRAHGVREPASLAWLEAPPAAALGAADELLDALGALRPDGSLSSVGHQLLRFPAHPRIGRMLVEAERRGVTAEASLHAALLLERDVALHRRTSAQADSPTAATESDSSDLAVSAELVRQAVALGRSPAILRQLGVDRGALRAVERTRQHLDRVASRGSSASARPAADDPEQVDEALRLCLLAGFPDRVARRVRDRDLSLAGGGRATLSSFSAVAHAGFLVALEAEERHDGRRGRHIVVHTASAIEPEWLLELFPGAIRETTEVAWNEARERVETVERMLYRSLLLHEECSAGAVPERAAEILAEAALARGLDAFAPADAVGRWLLRLSFARQAVPEAHLPELDHGSAEQVLRQLCAGRSSFAELRDAGLLATMQAQLEPGQGRLLDELAPERLRLPGGRQLQVHYERDKPPWAASRLQDFFGLDETPAVACGRVPLVLHLLAPNGRPVQITQDLRGFWTRTYDGVRRELRRRYPKHDWPADGRTARPPPPGRTRRGR